MRHLANLLDVITRTAMWALLPVGPVAAALIAKDGSYVRHYARSLRASVAHLHAMKRGRPIARAIERRLAEDLLSEQVDGSCSHCGRCCLDRACIFLRYSEEGHSRCQIYGSKFWKHLPCGMYPLNGGDIRLYNCPSFAVHAARVIPIKAVALASGEQPREVSQTA